jgi:hypothetical protein
MEVGMHSTFNKPEAPQAQAPSTLRRPFPRDYSQPTPREIAARQRQIRIARAVALVARTSCDCTTAARAIFGLARFRDVLAIRDLCDQQCIPRKHNWGSELRVWANVEPASAYVKPRKQGGI